MVLLKNVNGYLQNIQESEVFDEKIDVFVSQDSQVFFLQKISGFTLRRSSFLLRDLKSNSVLLLENVSLYAAKSFLSLLSTGVSEPLEIRQTLEILQLFKTLEIRGSLIQSFSQSDANSENSLKASRSIFSIVKSATAFISSFKKSVHDYVLQGEPSTANELLDKISSFIFKGRFDESLLLRRRNSESSSSSSRQDFECLICSEIFHDLLSSLEHLSKTHTNTSNSSIIFSHVCQFCQSSFSTLSEYVTHVYKHSPFSSNARTSFENSITTSQSINSSYICEICGKNYDSSNNMRTHIRMVHETKYFDCGICGKKIRQDSRFRHNLKHRPKGYQCTVCGSLFRETGDLRKHFLRKHASDEEKPNQCEICKKGFLTKCDLEGHNNAVHIRAKTIGCNYCDKSFFRRSTQRSHEKNVHCSEVGAYKCRLCKKKFINDALLSNHVSKVH